LTGGIDHALELWNSGIRLTTISWRTTSRRGLAPGYYPRNRLLARLG
jgi:hypothetical protein